MKLSDEEIRQLKALQRPSYLGEPVSRFKILLLAILLVLAAFSAVKHLGSGDEKKDLLSPPPVERNGPSQGIIKV